MFVELYSKFYYNESFDNNHLTLKQLDETSKNLLMEFIHQVVANEHVWGRNKQSAKNLDLKSIDKIYNYQTFLSNNLRHYHLVDNLNRSSTINYIFNDNETSSNTCDTLIHYELKDDRIIIYSVSKHGEWNDLLKIIDPTHLNYCICSICGVFSLKHGENCNCINNHQQEFMIIKKKTNTLILQEQKVVSSYSTPKGKLIITEKKIVNLSKNILIQNISDICNL